MPSGPSGLRGPDALELGMTLLPAEELSTIDFELSKDSDVSVDGVLAGPLCGAAWPKKKRGCPAQGMQTNPRHG